MTLAERNGFANLMLMCRNHHYRVDYLEPDAYPPERLSDIKYAHEKRRGSGEWAADAQITEYVRRLALAIDVTISSEGPRVRSRQVAKAPPQVPARPKPTTIRLSVLAAELGLNRTQILDLASRTRIEDDAISDRGSASGPHAPTCRARPRHAAR